MSGIDCNPIPGVVGDSSGGEYERVLRAVHKSTPSYSVLKTYMITQSDAFPPGLVNKKSRKGKLSKIEYFERALEATSLMLFKKVDDNNWMRLDDDVEKIDGAVAPHPYKASARNDKCNTRRKEQRRAKESESERERE